MTKKEFSERYDGVYVDYTDRGYEVIIINTIDNEKHSYKEYINDILLYNVYYYNNLFIDIYNLWIKKGHKISKEIAESEGYKLLLSL